MINKINLTSPICKTSYGYVGQNLVKALINKGVQVSLRILGDPDPDVECGYDAFLDKCSPQLFQNAPHIIIWHANGLGKFCLEGKSNWGFPIFELDTFTDQEVENLNKCVGLLCCSEWAKAILGRFTNLPIKVVPLGVDPDVFKPVPKAPEKVLRFINMGKWEVRKNQLALIKAFAHVFKGYNNVSLTLACHNEFIGLENVKWANFAQSLIPPHQLNIFPLKLNSQVDIANVLNQHDIGVFPSLGEGWNLELSEMMYLGKPCIATNYSAHTEFAGEANLIAIDATEEAFDGVWFFGQGNWAKWGKEQDEKLRDCLNESYRNSYNSDSTFTFDGFKKYEDIKKFTWENSANKLIEALNV